MTIQSPSITPLPIDKNGRTIQDTYRNFKSGTKGTVVTSGTAVQLTATPTEAKIVDIINPVSNANVIVIGDSTVSYSGGKGIPIEPGFTYRVNVQDLSQVWVDAQDSGATFQFNYFY